MTTVVTADKLVTALAQRINAGADTAVSGPNKQLKDAMVSKNFFDGSGGGGGGTTPVTMYASGVMNYGTVWDAARNATVTSDSIWAQYQGAARDVPVEALYSRWAWDTSSVNNPDFGEWSPDRTRFTFKKRCLASVVARGALVVFTSNSNFKNALAQLVTGNTSNLPQGRLGPAQESVSGSIPGSGTGWVHINLTLSQEFNAGDFVETRYVCHTVDGTATFAYYGSLRGIVSRMDINMISAI